MVCTSTCGSFTGSPPMAPSANSSTAPPRTSDTSRLVPPMSMVTTSRSPASRAAATAPTTPPAGPDSSVLTGCSRMRATLMTPPLDCMMRSGATQTTSAISASRSSATRWMAGAT